MFPSTSSRETSGLSGKQNCFPRDHTLSVYCSLAFHFFFLLKTVKCIMNRGRFKTEINHSVTQPVIHPSFLFFKVYLTYKLLFVLDQISFAFEVFGIVKTKLDFLQFFSAHFLPKSHSRYCRPSCTKVDVNSVQFNSFFYLTYTEYYVHKVKMILQYYLASSQQNEQLTCTFFNLFFLFFGTMGA